MTINGLVDELVVFLEKVVKEYDLNTNVEGLTKAPKVAAGFLGEKQKRIQSGDPLPDFPYILVRFLTSEINKKQKTGKVRILAGTYSEDTKEGWRYVANVLTRVEMKLLNRPSFGAFTLDTDQPIKTTLPEEQPFPEWVGWIEVSFLMPRIQIEDAKLRGGQFDDEFWNGFSS
ncbi:hypothetical protein BTO30_14890 [Domibacillus antri]|uniref:Uncharacterized protein n=1 Tax=Domibacillus antri TaxID=1714264 RepID=A0A1Q8Q235_9BACI|nr:hypothetical protein [Domibacillus antri]OLN21404.1 hypothetical protein BTO30_14890 [Domibacillus antri]